MLTRRQLIIRQPCPSPMWALRLSSRGSQRVTWAFEFTLLCPLLPCPPGSGLSVQPLPYLYCALGLTFGSKPCSGVDGPLGLRAHIQDQPLCTPSVLPPHLCLSAALTLGKHLCILLETSYVTMTNHFPTMYLSFSSLGWECMSKALLALRANSSLSSGLSRDNAWNYIL